MSDRASWVVTDQSAVTITATTNGTAYLSERYAECTMVVNVTAASGTNPTLDVSLKVGPTDSVLATAASMTQITATGTYYKAVSGNIGQYSKPVYTVGGTTPSFTFSAYLIFKT